MMIYFYVNVSGNFVIQERVDPLSKKRFWKTSTVCYKNSSIDRKVVEKQKSTIFDIFGNFTEILRKFNWLGYTQSDEKENKKVFGVFLKCFLLKGHNFIQKVSNHFPSNL